MQIPGNRTGHFNCVDGACLISEYPQGQNKLCEVRKGDKILAHDGGESTVTCVLHTGVHFRGDLPLIHLPGGCRITPGHPVRLNLNNPGHQADGHPGTKYEHFTDWIKPHRIATHHLTA
eukprot:16116830-Heterocapsa_arctica.AAC.1